MDRISATIITRNEESQIERCLNSLYGVADEIVVVDSYSTDRTVEISRRYGCKVTQRAFTGFGSQRQYAVGLTANSYILSIDADEVLSDELRAELIAMKKRGLEHRVYSFNVIHYFCGKALRHSGWCPGREIKLFNKRYANWNLLDIAESVTFDSALIPCHVTNGRIDHFRVNTPDEFSRKEQRRYSIQARMIAASNKHIRPLTPLVRACMDFLDSHLRDYAFLDGHDGNTIALQRYNSTFAAYRIARSILLKRKHAK